MRVHSDIRNGCAHKKFTTLRYAQLTPVPFSPFNQLRHNLHFAIKRTNNLRYIIFARNAAARKKVLTPFTSSPRSNLILAISAAHFFLSALPLHHSAGECGDMSSLSATARMNLLKVISMKSWQMDYVGWQTQKYPKPNTKKGAREESEGTLMRKRTCQCVCYVPSVLFRACGARVAPVAERRRAGGGKN